VCFTRNASFDNAKCYKRIAELADDMGCWDKLKKIVLARNNEEAVLNPKEALDQILRLKPAEILFFFDSENLSSSEGEWTDEEDEVPTASDGK
jgi:hypothetical protein